MASSAADLGPFLRQPLRTLTNLFTLVETEYAKQLTAPSFFLDVTRAIRKTRLNKNNQKVFFVLQPCTKTLQWSRFLPRAGWKRSKAENKKATRATRNWVHLLHAADRREKKLQKRKFLKPLKWIKSDKNCQTFNYIRIKTHGLTTNIDSFTTTLKQICIKQIITHESRLISILRLSFHRQLYISLMEIQRAYLTQWTWRCGTDNYLFITFEFTDE